MNKIQRNKPYSVDLNAYDADGAVVEQVTLSTEDYYEGLHDLIDSDVYRMSKGIAIIEGRIFGPSGEVDQEFRNRYSESGSYLGGRAAHADGTIVED